MRGLFSLTVSDSAYIKLPSTRINAYNTCDALVLAVVCASIRVPKTRLGRETFRNRFSC